MASSFGDGATSVPSDTAKFLNDNIAWVRRQVSAHPDDSLWVNVGLQLTMLEGLLAGYNADPSVKDTPLTMTDMWALNSDGDLEEIVTITDSIKAAKIKKGLPVTIQPTGTHCSVLVKVTDDFSNIIMAHTTWEDFVQMLRIYKVYELDFFGARVSFSSYPAVITSIDDFYITSNKLGVTETTNGIYSQALFNKIVPQALLSWQRAMAANTGAHSCEAWMSTFGRHNSGTYNNQWICVDYNKFTPKKALQPGTLWIGEQIPGLFETADVTTTLGYGYWPSYNIPYFPNIYNASGFQNQPYGDWFSYSLCPRAKIFRRDHGKVHDLTTMQKMIRYNDWQNDPFSQGNPCNAISSRCDLVQGNPSNPDIARSAFGSVDGKTVDYYAIQKGITYAQAGPTHDQQSPFTWSAEWSDQPHGLQPSTFKFPWVAMDFPRA